MPQGCDFLCGNSECENHGKRITIHGPWPLKPIDEAIAEAEGEHKAGLEGLKAKGRPTALFVFPADKGRAPVGWRAQLYCEKDRIVFAKDFLSKQEAVDINLSPPNCEKCGGGLKSLKMAIESGIKCPSCGHIMNPNYWFTK